jgi:mRNA-degrading endonuclease YafQ of YafQ-DinJ toxin-antitoxin module
MRINEIVGFDRHAVTTDQFDQDFAKLTKMDPDAAGKLQRLIDFKRTSAADQSMSKKDYVFSYGELRGYWHYHLVFGRDVVIYQLTRNEIRLICIVPHAQIERGYDPGLISLVVNLTPEDFHPFAAATALSGTEISQQVLDDTLSIIYGLAANPDDRKMLAAAAQGTWDQDLVDYLVVDVPGSASDDDKWQALAAAMGGLAAFSDRIRMILRRTATG